MKWGARGWRIGAVCLAVLLLSASASAAATINVTTTADPDSTGVGDCLTTDTSCSLREAVNAANQDQSDDAILLPAGIYELTQPALVQISASLTLAGTGAGTTTIKQTVANENVLNIENNADVTVQGVTITGGHSGGGLAGGGIDNQGSLTLAESAVAGNEADGYVFELCISPPACEPFPMPGTGGGIFSGGPLTIIRSTISGNIASGGPSAGAEGGGIDSQGELTVSNSTIAGNSAKGEGGAGEGGGIYQAGGTGRSLKLANVTIAFNAASGSPDQGGNLYLDTSSGSLTSAVQNSIVAEGIAGSGYENCAGSPLTSDGYNLEDRQECGLTGPGDRHPKSAALAQLHDNGGQTETVALLGNSPAINGGNPGGCKDPSGVTLTADERGVTRPQGAACDIGAFEYQVPTAAGAPKISGHPRPGSKLTCVLPQVKSPDGPAQDVIGWDRSGKPIAAGGAYTVTTADEGHSLTCVLRVENPAGQATAASKAVQISVIPSVRLTSTHISGHSATFRFTTRHATGAQCALAKKGQGPSYSPCASPKEYKRLHRGNYTFYVRAMGQGGPSAPAKSSFSVS